MKTKNFLNESLSLKKGITPDNGSRMARQWTDNGPANPLAILTLFLMLFSFGVGNAWGGNEVYKTALFGSTYNSKGVQDYTSTWSSTNSSFTVTVVNGNNNNNGWSTVKFGRKNNASTGKITTSAAIDKKITQVRITVDAVTSNKINSIKLYKSSNGSTWTELGSFAVSTGAKDVAIAAGDQATNLYYEIRFDCASGTSNGLITISRVDYYIDGVTTTSVTLNKNTGSTNGSAEFSLGESAYTSFTAATPASCKICTGYWTSTSGGNKVLNPDGSFAASNVTGWITSGKWSKDATTATLYAQWEEEIYTITLKDNDATLTQGSCGAAVTLPSRTGCSGYTFAGWTKSWTEEQDEWTTAAPTIIEAGSYTPTENEELYPVYTKTEVAVGTTTKSYGWETENPSDWTIGAQPSRNNSNANTGSYAGFINTNHTYVTFNEKVKVTAFSFYLKRTSTNSNYNVYIETSTDGSSWTAAETYSMNDFGNGSYTKKEKTWDGKTAYYVRFHCYNTTAVRYVDDISISYTGGFTTSYISVPDCCSDLITLSDPTITGSGCTITFDESSPVETCSAAQDVTASLTVTNGYKVTALSFTLSTGTYTIDPAISTPYTSSQDFTLSFAQNHAAATLTTTATVEALHDKYKDYLHGNATIDREGNYGTAPSLSSQTAATDAGCKDNHYKFKGWVAEADVNTDGTLKGGYVLIAGGATGKYATGTTYIAVWAEEVE